MPSSPSVIKAGKSDSLVRSWQPGLLGGGPEYPGLEKPPFVPGTAPVSLPEETPSLPAFEPVFKPAASGAPAGWQPLNFRRLEFEPAPLPSGPELQTAEAGRRLEFRVWQPVELELYAPEPERVEEQAVEDGSALLEAARAQAGEILEEARANAAAVLVEAQAKAAEIIREAEDQAGAITRQGYSDGMAAANAETAELLQTVTAMVAEVNTWREEMFAQGELMMLRLVIEIAQTIFGDGLPLDPDTLGAAFSRALSQAKTLGDLRIYVHPEDAEALGPQWVKQQSAISGQRIELVPSEIIKRGGCFIEGDYGTVDSRVESQFKLVQDTLLASQAASQAASYAAPPVAQAEIEEAASQVAVQADEMQPDEIQANEVQAGEPGPAPEEDA